MLKIVQRFWRRTRFRYRVHRGLAVDLALAIAGVVLLWPGQSVLKDATGLLCTVIGTWRFVQGLAERWDRYRRISIVENLLYGRTLAQAEMPAGFELHAAGIADASTEPMDKTILADADLDGLRPYLTNPSVNRLLDTATSPIEMAPRRYRVSERLIQYQFHSLGLFSPHDNEEKLGLRTDIAPTMLERNDRVRLQRTDYFSGSATNEMATKQFEIPQEDGRGAPIVLASVSDAIVTRSQLTGLAGHELSNHVGVSALVLSADDHLMLQYQGRQNVSADELGPGASGSLDRHDLRLAGDPPTLQALCRAGMEREAAEELGAAFAVSGAIPGSIPGQATVLTGYARFLLRGGKPEFFGIARSTTRSEDMERTAAEQHYVRGLASEPFDPGAAGLIAAIDRMFDSGWFERRFSVSLVVSLRLARAWLETAPPDALGRIGLTQSR